MIRLAPSILSADFAHLSEDIKKLELAETDLIHIDVMDGSFVPNISFGVPIIKSIRNLTKIPFDVHLMIEEPGRFVEDFYRAGADNITVHYEADRHIDRTLNYIKSLGIEASLAINPGTPISSIMDLLPLVDMVLIMTVNPGFGGQSYIPYCGEKVKRLREIKESRGLDFKIEVDGGITKDNISDIVKLGADTIVAGSSIFKDGKIQENVNDLRKMIIR